jgi:hypothetical protein
MTPGPFVTHAHKLLSNGYSPIPLWPGKKSPIPEGWPALCETPITEEQLTETAKRFPKAGLGVAGGCNGLVPIDIDTDDEAAVAAIRGALPETLVGKRGMKGATLFYRSRDPLPGRRFKDANGKPIVEVLTSGQSVIPPTMHPDTGEPYFWTTEATLLDTCVDDLPEITVDHLMALQEALRPWLPPPKEYKPRSDGAGNGTHGSNARVRAYAEAALVREAKELAAMGEDTGRNNKLFAASCKLGNFVHHGVLSESKVCAALLDACVANGLSGHIGLRGCEKTLANGLRWAERDELREPKEPRSNGNGYDNGHANGYDYEAKKGQEQQKPRRIRLVPFHQITLGTQRRDLIKGLIPRIGLSVIWGPPKCGKSFIAFDMFMHVVLGWEYRGRRVHAGPVVYCAFEGQQGFRARKEAWCQERLAEAADDVPFYLMPLTLNLVQGHSELIEAIKHDVGNKPAAVVLDTLNRSIQGSEDNGQDMGAYIRASDAIREAFECAVVIIHHCGHNGERPRGHSSLVAAADAVLSVRKDAAGQIVTKVDLMKDGPEGEELASRLRHVEVGQTDDGDRITSCMVDAVAEVPLPQEQDLTLNQQTMFRILYRAGPEGLTQDEWNKRAREAGLGVSRRATLYDLRADLQTKKLVHEHQGVWRASRK